MNDTTVALAFVLAVLVTAVVSSRWVAIAASLVAFGGYNFFFLPPVGTFHIAQQEDLVALLSLLAVSLIGSHLSDQARRRAKESAALEAKSALVASLSHDLKTPLTALTVAAGNLGLPGLTDAERHEQMQIVQAELDRLKRLFDNVVDMASVEARAIRVEPEWVHPADVIEAARRQLGAMLDARDVRLSGNDGELLVRLDPRLTSAALVHVLENAAIYSSARTPIDIDVTVAPDRLAIAVRDHGPGLPPGSAERVFERFYRGNDTAHARFGSGMGLAIARGLLAIQRGSISASNSPEGGAVFTLDIPVESRPASEMALDVA